MLSRSTLPFNSKENKVGSIPNREEDLRDYITASQMFQDLNVTQVDLMTHNPEKIDGAIVTIIALDRAVRCGNATGESL